MPRASSVAFPAEGNRHGAMSGVKIDLAFDLFRSVVVIHTRWLATELITTIGKKFPAGACGQRRGPALSGRMAWDSCFPCEPIRVFPGESEATRQQSKGAEDRAGLPGAKIQSLCVKANGSPVIAYVVSGFRGVNRPPAQPSRVLYATPSPRGEVLLPRTPPTVQVQFATKKLQNAFNGFPGGSGVQILH